MFAGLVGEEPEDAFLLQQSRNEGEVGFAVLHAILARLVAAGERQLEVGEAMGLEDGGDDVAGGEVLEHPVVAGQRQPPEPGAQHHLIAVGGGIGGELADFCDQGIEGALVGVVVQGGGDMRGHGTAQRQRGGAVAIEGQAAQRVQRLVPAKRLGVKIRQGGGAEGEAGIGGAGHQKPLVGWDMAVLINKSVPFSV